MFPSQSSTCRRRSLFSCLHFCPLLRVLAHNPAVYSNSNTIPCVPRQKHLQNLFESPRVSRAHIHQPEIYTVAPASPSAMAIPLPIPLWAPVTTATSMLKRIRQPLATTFTQLQFLSDLFSFRCSTDINYTGIDPR